MNIPSDLVQQITGTFIEDDTAPKPPLLDWIQTECRHGCFRQALKTYVESLPEPFRFDLTIVEKAEPEKITLRMPGRFIDHESPSAFAVEGTFELNPVTLTIKRV